MSTVLTGVMNVASFLFRCSTAALLACSAGGFAAAPDSPWLYGIHWYGDRNATDVEAMTGGKGVWVLEHAFTDSTATAAEGNTWETPWRVTPTVDKEAPWDKVTHLNTVTGKGHSAVIRLHPYWSVQVPYPGDPYTGAMYADDCKAAANLMRNVRVWVIGNEANLGGENRRWNSSTQHYDLPWPTGSLENLPELYAQQYLLCRDKIHEITPDTIPANQIVLMQPVSPGGADGDRFMDGNEFLIRMIQAVPDKSKIDGFALHSYADTTTNYGADAYMEILRQQMMIIDQFGLGDRPIFVTEFNRHMPTTADVPLGAQFLSTAYTRMNSWNVNSSDVWPGQPSHKITGTNWFVYPVGWNEYSLLYYKTPGGTPTTEPWYAFQSIAAANYASGTGAGPSIGPNRSWWSDNFEGGTGALDTSAPLPHWIAEGGAGGSVALNGSGNVRLAGGTTNYGNASIFTPNTYRFADFKASLDVTFTNASRIAADEANFDLRIRERRDAGGFGYSLTMYSSEGTVRPGQVWLRRTNDWGTTYKSETIPGGINTGDRFRIEVTAEGPNLSYRIIRLGTGELVLDWTGTEKVVDSNQRFGGIRAMVYNMAEAQVENFFMGGPQSDLGAPNAARDWELLQ